MKNFNIKNLVKPSVRNLAAYQAFDIPCRIQLDANESPYAFKGDLSGILKNLKTNRYPDPEARELRRMLARRLAVSPANILFGNGSDELIYYMITTFGGPVLFPVPTFSMYGIISQALGEKSISILLDREFDIDLKKTLAAMKKERPKLIFLSSPNNPTGNCFSSDKILKIIEASSGIVVVDEAYQPFSSKSYIDRIAKNPELYSHVLLMRTLSKFGLAGVRIGYMMGPKALILEVDKVRPPYNISVLNYECALFALEHAEVFAEQAQEIRTQRAIIFEALRVMPGIKTWQSDANMILVRVPDAQKTFEGMRARRVLVKNVSKMHPLLANCLRLTVGAADENTQMLAALKESL